jgi:cytochrome c oxidase subunit 1
MTLATTVVLTFFGISYWLIPHLRGRVLTPLANRLGIVQTVIWSIGMLLMSVSMHIVGLLGEPRRTAYTTYADAPMVQSWLPYRNLMGVGSIFLFVGILLFLFIALYLWHFAPKTDRPVEYPIGEVNDKSPQPPLILERWSLWIGITVALILIAYAVPVTQMITHAPPGSPPIRSW